MDSAKGTDLMKVVALTSLLLVVTAGCSEGAPYEPSRKTATAEPDALTVSPAPTEAEACGSSRYVGQTTSVPAGTCPTPLASLAGSHASWIASSLFTGASAAGLQRFCAYDWVPDGTGQPVAPDTSRLPWDGAAKPLGWLSLDCHVAAPLAAAGDPSGPVRRDLHASLLGQLSSVPPPKGQIPITVAVVDTSPDRAGPLAKGTSGHGFAMGQLIENVTCPRADSGALLGGECTTSIASFVGLPLVLGDHYQPSVGGTYGRQTDVAAAIVRAVEAYRSRSPVDTGERLVVNLSLGWEPQWTFRGSVERPSARAVRAALTHAACHGALVIAAAGNDPGGPTPATGAMYPAAWEDLAAPTVQDCVGFEGIGSYAKVLPPNALSPGVYQPLLHSAGGVTRADGAIAVARPASRPRLVAPAADASGRTAAGEKVSELSGDRTLDTAEGTDVLTGTSIAAALTSGTAAMIWAQRPDLSAPQVMDLVYSSAHSLSATADVCSGCSRGGTHPDVKRLDACTALMNACAPGTADCHASAIYCLSRAGYTPVPPPLSAESRARLETEYAASSPIVATLSSAIVWSDSICGDYWQPAVAGAAPRCPAHENYQTTAEPWAGPQPGWPECPSCVLAVSSTGTHLYALLDPYAGTLTNPTLRLTYDWGAVLEVDISAAVPSMRAGVPVRISTLGIPYPDRIVAAQIIARSTPATGRATSVTIPLQLAN